MARLTRLQRAAGLLRKLLDSHKDHSDSDSDIELRYEIQEFLRTLKKKEVTNETYEEGAGI